MTGSRNNGLPQCIEPTVDANYVFAFVRDTRRSGDEGCGRANRLEDNSESSTADEEEDGEIAIIRMDASRNSQRQMEPTKPLKVL